MSKRILALLLVMAVAVFLAVPAFALVDFSVATGDTKAYYNIGSASPFDFGDNDPSPAEAFYPSAFWGMASKFELKAAEKGAKVVGGFAVDGYSDPSGAGFNAPSGDPYLAMKLFNTLFVKVGKFDGDAPNNWFVAQGGDYKTNVRAQFAIEPEAGLASTRIYYNVGASGGFETAGYAGDTYDHTIGTSLGIDMGSMVFGINVAGTLGFQYPDTYDSQNDPTNMIGATNAQSYKLKLNLTSETMDITLANFAFGMKNVATDTDATEFYATNGFMVGHEGWIMASSDVKIMWALAFMPASAEETFDPTGDGGANISATRFNGASDRPEACKGIDNDFNTIDLLGIDVAPDGAGGYAAGSGVPFFDYGYMGASVGANYTSGDTTLEGGVAFHMVMADADNSPDGFTNLSDSSEDRGQMVGLEFGFKWTQVLPDSDGIIFSLGGVGSVPMVYYNGNIADTTFTDSTTGVEYTEVNYQQLIWGVRTQLGIGEF